MRVQERPQIPSRGTTRRAAGPCRVGIDVPISAAKSFEDLRVPPLDGPQRVHNGATAGCEKLIDVESRFHSLAGFQNVHFNRLFGNSYLNVSVIGRCD